MRGGDCKQKVAEEGNDRESGKREIVIDREIVCEKRERERERKGKEKG